MSVRQGPDLREYLFKVLVIGELGTGKTSFIKRYVHQFFSTHYRATIGVDFALKVIKWSKNSLVRIQLWDIAGQERFGQMTRVYYKEAAGAIIVFDVTQPASFEAVLKWKADLDQKVSGPDGSPIPTLLLANKCDESKSGSLGEETFLNQFCEEHGFIGWFYTSPKENINIEDSANFLIKGIISRRRSSRLSEGNQDEDSLSIEETGEYNRHAFSLTSRMKESSSKCC